MSTATLSPERRLFARRVSPALGFALGAALICAALAALSPAILNDSDTYWQIVSGGWMLDHGAVLTHDPFSYTAAGQTVSTQSWLAEIIMTLAFRAGGWAGIHVLFAAAAGTSGFVVARFLRARMDFAPASIATALGLACVAPSLLARPHMLALPLLALWTAGLVRARENHRVPPLSLLAVMVLWANLHGSFAFGLALTTALGAEAVVAGPGHWETARRWGLFVLGAAAAAMATPAGWHTLWFPFRLTDMGALTHIGEWQASSFTHPGPLEYALLALLGVLATGKVRVPLIRALILLGLVHMALTHARHQMLLGVTGTLLLAPALAAAWPAKNESASPLLAITTALLLVLGLGVRAIVPAPRGPGAMTPQAALAYVPASIRTQPVLNDYAFGGYLIWNGIKPFIDSRADLYGDAFLSNYAAIIRPDKTVLTASLARHHVRWTIFGTHQPVVGMMDTLPGWHRLYTGKIAVVHVRD